MFCQTCTHCYLNGINLQLKRLQASPSGSQTFFKVNTSILSLPTATGSCNFVPRGKRLYPMLEVTTLIRKVAQLHMHNTRAKSDTLLDIRGTTLTATCSTVHMQFEAPRSAFFGAHWQSQSAIKKPQSAHESVQQHNHTPTAPGMGFPQKSLADGGAQSLKST
jgi:hypothetical protein